MRGLGWLMVMAACSSDVATPAGPDASLAETPDAAGPCDVKMALVGYATPPFCIDRFEGALEEQVDGAWTPASPFHTVGDRVVRAVPADHLAPQGYISGSEAAAACARSGKRLCTSEEWLAACHGPDDTLFPYGAAHVAGACNDDYAGHPLVDFFGTSEGVWDTVHMNDPGINQQPGTIARGGERSACKTPSTDVFDMHGNLHEWVADESGTFRGGFYADGFRNGPGCTYATTRHTFDYHDYSTGFRCCADAR